MHSEHVERWARLRGFTLEEDLTLPPDSAVIAASGILRYGPGTDLDVMMFHMNLTKHDRAFLKNCKVAL